MANLLHENKKMTVFEALEVLEALKSKYSFVAGESKFTANVIVFLPKKDVIDTDENDGNNVNCIPDNLCGMQLLSDAELDLQGTGATKLITDESQALASGQVRFCVFSVSRILGYLLVTFNQTMFPCQNNIVFRQQQKSSIHTYFNNEFTDLAIL